MTCRAAERIQGIYKKWGPYYKEVWETGGWRVVGVRKRS